MGLLSMKRILYSIGFLIALCVTEHAHGMRRGMQAAKLFTHALVSKAQKPLSTVGKALKTNPKVTVAVAGIIGGGATIYYYCQDQAGKSTDLFDEYTVNLMWINKTRDENQPFIHRATNPEELQKNFLDPIFTWAKLHAKGKTIDVWFDSTLTPAIAVKNTQLLIDQYQRAHPKAATIRLRDIRSLPQVIKEPEVFSDKTPVYFRADLVRLVAAYNAITTKETQNFVYADLDMVPQCHKELFDQETRENLQKYGIVMARDGHLGFENGFFIISNYNNNLLHALNWAIIQVNIQRAHNALRGNFLEVNGRRHVGGPMIPLEQIIYDSFPSMLKYFYSLENYGMATVDEYETSSQSFRQTPYNKEVHGLKPFGLNKLHYNGLSFTWARNESIKDEYGTIIPPTKVVDLPPAGHQYHD